MVAPAVAAVVLLAALAAYWLLVVTEGTFLGARVVARLYDLVAYRYDDIKSFDPQTEEMFLTRPLLTALRHRPTPLVLDVATGTGRVPTLLLASPTFSGRVIGLDYAREMLAQAAQKARSLPKRVALIWQNAMQLPFSDGCFDLVTCLEALEFVPRPKRVLAELMRVTRPGGLIVTTRRRGWERKTMLGKGWTESAFRALLAKLGATDVRVIPWQVDYDLVWAWKPTSGPVVSVPSFEVDPESWPGGLLRCPACNSRPLRSELHRLICDSCRREYRVADDGVIEMAGRNGQRARTGAQARASDARSDYIAG